MSLSPAEREALIQQYADGPNWLERAIEAVPEAARAWRPGPGKWTAHEVVCHCADSEMHSALRIRTLLIEDRPTIRGYDQDAWAIGLDYAGHPLAVALAAVRAARNHTVPLLRKIPAAAWSRTGTHSESGAYGCEIWLQTYAAHLEIHARQIERNLAAWRQAAR
jgi:hypothetical protein